MSDHFTLYLNESTVADINKASKNLWTVPTVEENDTLYVKSDTEKKWKELLEVRDTKVEKSEDKKYVIFTVQYRASDDGYPKPNRGRVMTKSYWVNMEALHDANDDDHKKAKMNMTKIVQLIKACDIPLEKDATGEYPFHLYFNGDQGVKPLVGKVFWGILRDYVYKSRKEEVGLVNDQDVDRFIKVTQ